MKEFSFEHLEDLVRKENFTEAVQGVNIRYREVCAEVLLVFEKFLKVLAEPSFTGDLKSVRCLLRLGAPSPKFLLKEFLANPRATNCLAAVLQNLEKSVPVDVKMGFTKVARFFEHTDFSGTFKADIVQYEPDFSRLTDIRFVRLLTVHPNELDLSLFNGTVESKKREVVAVYQSESLEPIKDIFLETLDKCNHFLSNLKDFADSFRQFFDMFLGRKFVPDENTFREWSVLGEDYFNIEVVKSSLMLPISPRALYWGMQKEYPVTLAKLQELKDMVSPAIDISDARADGDGVLIRIACRNPETVKSGSFSVEQTILSRPDDSARGESFQTLLSTVESDRLFEYRFVTDARQASPLLLTVKVTCEARFYPAPFTQERTFELG